MAVGYRYSLEREENGWFLVRFPEIPEALTEGETEAEAHAEALDCVLAALEGYVKAGRGVPRPIAPAHGEFRAVLPTLVTAKLVVHETMRAAGWSRAMLAARLGIGETALRRVLDLRHRTQIQAIDQALAAMNAELAIELPSDAAARHAA